MLEVTSGVPSGMSGIERTFSRMVGRADVDVLRIGAIVILAVALASMVVNAMTVHSDNPGFRVWEPWVWEGSSALSLALLIWIPWLSAAAAPVSDFRAGAGRIVRFVALHIGALTAFSVLHVTGFVLLRRLAYKVMNYAPYVFGDVLERFAYELRKDALSYCLFVGVFSVVASLRQRRKTSVLPPETFDIQDGSRIHRVEVAHILAVSSAGNYVEFWLADGRRFLMRMTLSAAEDRFQCAGLVRVHRSWLVNVGQMRSLTPDGSGDWTVDLGGLQVPLSRRFPNALAELRGPRDPAKAPYDGGTDHSAEGFARR